MELIVNSESRALYEYAIKELGLESMFQIVDRPPPEPTPAEERNRQWMALDGGRRTLKAIKKHLAGV